MAFELILTGDTFNEGRIKINNAFNEGTDFWSGTSTDDTIFINDAYPNVSINSLGEPFTYNLALGASNTVSDEASVGLFTQNYATAIGYGNIANGQVSHAEGESNIASGTFSHVGGKGMYVSGTTSFAHSRRQANNIASLVPAGRVFGESGAVLGGVDCSIIPHRDGFGAGYSNVFSSKSVILGSESAYIIGQNAPAIPARGRQYGESSVIVGCRQNGPDTEIYNEAVNGSFIMNTNQSYVKQNNSDLSQETNVNNVIIAGKKSQIEDSSSAIIIGAGINSPGSTPNNKISASKTSTIISSNFSSIHKSTKSVVSGGVGNLISYDIGSGGQTGSYDFLRNSAILAGKNNTIANYWETGSTSDTTNPLTNCVIIGGQDNEILGYKTKDIAIIGGNNNRHENTNLDNQKPFSNVILGGEKNVIIAGNAGRVVKNSVLLGGGNKILSEPNFAPAAINVFNIMAGRGIARRVGDITNTFEAGYSATLVGAPNYTNRTILLNVVSGSGYWDGALIVGSADYAEYFEWQDGNLNDEKRYGYFVSLVGNKIEIGNSNVVGTVSPTPGFIGDSPSLKWSKSYLKDEFRRKLKVEYKIYLISGDTGNIDDVKIYIDESENVYKNYPNLGQLDGVLYTGDTKNKVYIGSIYENKINPNYDKDQEYLSRKERKEWSPIGILGKLHVRTSEQITSDKISADSNGEAINGTDYHVLKSIKDYDGDYGIVQILFK
mgnify:CR=1 FL=1